MVVIGSKLVELDSRVSGYTMKDSNVQSVPPDGEFVRSVVFSVPRYGNIYSLTFTTSTLARPPQHLVILATATH